MTLALVLSLLAPTALGQCKLPAFSVPEEWRACTKDADCALASDDCRRCSASSPVAKVHLNDATMADLEKRLAAKPPCIIQCKPCDPATLEVRCVDSFCTAKKRDKPVEQKKAEPEPKKAEPEPKK